MYCIDNDKDKKNINNLIEAIIKENLEYSKLQNSEVIQKNIMIRHFISHLKKRDFRRIFNRLVIRNNIKKLPQDYDVESNYSPERNYFSAEKIAIYTALFGSYDEIQEPTFIPDNCDFYIITDQQVKSTTWKQINLLNNFPEINSLSNIEKNRFFKMNPHLFFPDYKYSIYVDANVKLIGDPTAFINCIDKYGIAMHRHRSRNCVYSEVIAGHMLKKIDKKQMVWYLNLLKDIDMPHHYGLAECNLIAREHNNNTCVMAMEKWWDLFLNGSVKRDQLFLPIVMYEMKIDMNSIIKLGTNIYDNPMVRIIYHN